MNGNKLTAAVFAILMPVLLSIPALSGCGKNDTPAATAEPVVHAEPAGPAEAAEKALSIPGTWETASMGYEVDGVLSPEYCVRFTDSEILYGHLKDGDFVLDHADRISLLEETESGGFRIQAESANGTRYTYQTCADDADILEYFETWEEAAFPEAYRGGASLSKVD